MAQITRQWTGSEVPKVIWTERYPLIKYLAANVEKVVILGYFGVMTLYPGNRENGGSYIGA